jgi:hypothetical protein
MLALLQGNLTPILQQVYTSQFPVAPAIFNSESKGINEIRNDKGTNHVPGVHTPFNLGSAGDSTKESSLTSKAFNVLGVIAILKPVEVFVGIKFKTHFVKMLHNI